MKISRLTVLGVCAGQGALLFPFRNELLANIEPRSVFHTPNEEQWKANFKKVPFIKGYDLPDLDKGAVDIICSSPDCGASSVMRLSKVKTLGKPNENKSINLVLEAIKKYTPKLFIIENLPRLLSLISMEYLENELFPDYNITFHISSVAYFGNSQVSRERLVLIGIHKKNAKRFKNSFKRVFLVNHPKNTSDILEPAHNERNYNIPLNKVLAMYDYRKLPEKKNLTVKEIHYLWNHDFKDEKKWPIKTAKMSTLPGVYRLEEDKPPLTVRPADRQFRPDGYPLGILDFKNLMGFPKSFKVYFPESPSDKEYLYWLNKARYSLAKGSVYEVGKWFKKCIQKTP